MTYRATVVNVMIASPSDVGAERLIAKDVVAEWSAINAQHRKLVLLPVGWETHASPEFGERPQEIINRQILKDCDLLIAIFWTRIGSPTGKAQSGTIEEIEEHIQAGKPAMLYFSSVPVLPDSVDGEQYAALRKFKAEILPKALVVDYATREEFRVQLTKHLAQTVNRQFQTETDDVEAETASHTYPSMPVLSEEAKELLLEASKSPGGEIMKLGRLGGLILQANGRNFIQSNNNREVARWRDAVTELANLGLIHDRGYKGEMFEITTAGYKIVDQLTAS